MTIFSIVLFIHVLSALGLFIAIAFEGIILTRLRSAQSREQLQFFVRLSRRLGIIYGPAFLGLLFGGIYLAYQLHIEAAWIPSALIATLLMALIGGITTGRKMSQLRKALTREGNSLGSELAVARSRSLLVSYGFRAGLAVGIVFLMTATPGLIVSIVALSLASVLGVGLALVSRWSFAGVGGGREYGAATDTTRS